VGTLIISESISTISSCIFSIRLRIADTNQHLHLDTKRIEIINITYNGIQLVSSISGDVPYV
jgi:hypothetical protein